MVDRNIKQKEILLVDDEEDIREVLSITLEDLGYDVHTVENAHKALNLFEGREFQIVLTDIKMPGMDGIELLKKIKQTSPFTEVIMITGHGDMDLAIESFRNEAVEFITKPVDVTKLERAVRRAEAKIETRQGVMSYTQNLENLVLKKSEALKQSLDTPFQDQKEITDIMDTLHMVIFFIDDHYRVGTANNLFKEMFGDPDGRHCYALCMGRSAPCSECPAMLTFEDGTPRQVERTFVNADLARVNTIGVSEATSTSAADSDTQSLNYLSWFSPIMDRQSKRVSEVLIMATDISKVMDIQDHLTSLGLMIGSVSHGIKGLLTGLDGGVYLLNSALNKDDQNLAREGLDMVKQMTTKIRKMILDILYYAKERELILERVSASAFAKDLVATMSPKVKANDIRLTTRFPDEDITFQADPAALHAALINMFDNAVDACVEAAAVNSHKKSDTPDDNTGDGDAEVSGDSSVKVKSSEIVLQWETKSGALCFAISDNGIGMDPDEIKKAFTLFHSGKGKKGTGLGLFIAKKTIQQHSGRIDVTSKKGVGTSFYVTLPLNLGQ